MNLVQYWHSPTPPADVRDLIASFGERNLDMRHRVFNEEGAAKFISEHLTRRELDAFGACAVPAMQSDYFRYCALFALGGIYSDVDVICKRPLRTLVETVDGGLLVGAGPEPSIANGFLVFPAPGHPLPRLLIDIATSNIELRSTDEVGLVTGPLILTCLRTLYLAGSFAAARDELPEPRLRQLMENVFAVAGDYERVRRAFDGVRVAAPKAMRRWLAMPRTQLRYQRETTHWTRWPAEQGSIFR